MDLVSSYSCGMFSVTMAVSKACSPAGVLSNEKEFDGGAYALCKATVLANFSSMVGVSPRVVDM